MQHSRNQKQKLNAETTEVNAEATEIGQINILKQVCFVAAFALQCLKEIHIS
jgi:hypothetical protein